ncbi:glycosyltransferase family 2 protein [Picosynechococcus sp. PCC 8807]|uniref:glycosyltransferase family 2 protein n=1 Tax=Picosynechococcus sp. PCC 8807 TaxID=195248 RepID=UPI000810C1B4|nr:glycosyltransferase family 2 protein [Picosynechococcus sp. PCC 8807]ANV90517.1 glycosyl transferase [Picosynechococcus sp. PCC 8807]
MLESITPLILTYNEAPNIKRTLQQLQWASRIVVIDSFSTDATLEILKRYPQVEIFQRKFDTHAKQWNFGLEQIQSEWGLSLDADYALTDALIDELKILSPSPEIDGYFIPFKYCVFGKPLRGTILPPRQALFRKGRSHYIDDGHTQLLVVQGQSESLSNPILHDDRKSLSRWLWAQDRYMVLEVKKLQKTPLSELGWGDRLRKQKILAPIIIFFYCLIFKGGIFDGWHGWYYAFQRVFAETLLSLRLIEADLSSLSMTTRPPQKLN